MAKPVNLPYGAPEEPGVYSISLHFQHAGSDKVYQISIEEKGDGFVVNFANGRTGGTLSSGTKTREPVDYAAARKICNATLNDKVGKGYNPTAGSHLRDGMAAQAIETAERKSSGYVPQLANPLPLKDIGAYIRDPNWIFEEKHDGERRLLIVSCGEVVGSNRRGITVPVQTGIQAAASSFGCDLVLDGEIVGDILHVWDLLEVDGVDIRNLPLEARQKKMDVLDFAGAGGLIVRTPAAVGPEEKRALYDRLKGEGKEGIVGKHLSSCYEPGRPNSGGNWFKLKNWSELTAAVGDVNTQRSVAMSLLDDAENWISVGNVTIPANHKIPEIGDVIEVRYLYAYEDGSLFQPIFGKMRNDIPLDECRASQRVFKPDSTPAAEQESPSL